MLTRNLQLQRARVNANQIHNMDRDMQEKNLAMLESITDFQQSPHLNNNNNN